LPIHEQFPQVNYKNYEGYENNKVDDVLKKFAMPERLFALLCAPIELNSTFVPLVDVVV
jgi:hypothetical protein